MTSSGNPNWPFAIAAPDVAGGLPKFRLVPRNGRIAPNPVAQPHWPTPQNGHKLGHQGWTPDVRTPVARAESLRTAGYLCWMMHEGPDEDART